MVLFVNCALFAVLSSTLLLSQVAAVDSSGPDCSCGYSVNSTSAAEHAVFTEILETDFRRLTSTWSNSCWQPQIYNMTPDEAHGTYGKMAISQNAVLNPEGGSGDAGLQLWVNSTIIDNMIPMAEIAARDESIGYGSFRVGMKITNVSGTCSGFFWYRNDSEEIDMEFLSSQTNLSSHPIYLVIQGQSSQSSSWSAASHPTFSVLQLPFDPTLDFHEYRFDWTPGKVSFYADGSWIRDMPNTYPNTHGSLSLNHWSNGNLGWSQGPPQMNAVTTIAYVRAYYNSTDPRKQSLFNSQCVNQSGTNQVCQIPDLLTWSLDDKRPSFISSGQCGKKIMPISSIVEHPTHSSTLISQKPTSTLNLPRKSTQPQHNASSTVVVHEPVFTFLVLMISLWMNVATFL